jgi:integrase
VHWTNARVSCGALRDRPRALDPPVVPIAWLPISVDRDGNITAGPVFRPIAKGERLQEARLTDRSVAKIVKAHAARVGLDPAGFSGHSLRSGFLTSAAARGASVFKMMVREPS